MPIYKGLTKIGNINKGTTPIANVYKGAVLVYSSAKWLSYGFTNLYFSLIPTIIQSRNVLDKLKISKVYGNSVVENQLLKGTQLSDYTIDNVVTSFNDNVLSCSLSVNNVISRVSLSANILQGHKYLFCEKIKIGETVPATTIRLTSQHDVFSSTNLVNNPTANTTYNIALIITAIGSYTNDLLRVCCFEGTKTIGGSLQLSNIQLFDLTQMFPFDTPTTLTDVRVQALLNRGYIPYNTGELKSVDIGEFSTTKADTTALATLPFIYQGNGVGTSHDTFEITNTEYVFTKNMGSVDLGSLNWQTSGLSTETNHIWYVNNFNGKVRTSNLLSVKYTYVEESLYSTSPNTVCVLGDNSLRINTGSSSNTPTGLLFYELATPQVIRIPKKHLGIVDLGSFTWDTTSYSNVFSQTHISNIKRASSLGTTCNIFTTLYQTTNANNVSGGTTNNVIAITPSGYVWVRDTSCSTPTEIKNKLSGIYLFYETESEVADIETQIQVEAGGTITSDSNVLPDVDTVIKCK